MKSNYQYIIVESYIPTHNRGFHGEIHIRPIEDQGEFTPDLHVRCAKELSYSYRVGTKFRIQGKITTRQGGKPFVHSPYTFPYDVLKD